MRRARAIPPVVAVLFCAFYAATYTHRLFHDAANFISNLEGGTWGYMHVLYLPAAQSTWHALRLVESAAPPELALAVLAVVSGGAAVGMATAFAMRVAGDLPGAVAGVLSGVCAAVWFGGTHGEHLLFGGLGAGLAMWLAWTAPFGTSAALFAAALLAPLFHFSGMFLVPGLVALAIAGARHRAEALPPRRIAGMLAAVVVAIVLCRLIVAFAMGVSMPAGAAGVGLVRDVLELLTQPGRIAERFVSELLVPYAALAVAPLALLLLRPPGSAALVIAILLLVVPPALPPMTKPSIEGQYQLVTFPALAAALALCLAAVPRRFLLPVVTVVALAHGTVSTLEFRRLRECPDRDWADAVAAHTGADDWVICANSRRARYLLWRDVYAIDLKQFVAEPPEAVAQVLIANAAENLARDRGVWYDGALFRSDTLPWVQEVLRLVRPHVAFEEHLDGRVRRLTAAR